MLPPDPNPRERAALRELGDFLISNPDGFYTRKAMSMMALENYGLVRRTMRAGYIIAWHPTEAGLQFLREQRAPP